ncbi:chorismate synthase [Tannockella kyphosi]|uniref:chorismate synthase n=1 Tax=Tannockella kyphosi TaxID=2899121 RepID=UPI0020117664|nr:chorismate synthase [Tannockella kyphosi]
MSATWKNNIEISIFGESHGKAIGVLLGNLPSGIILDKEFIHQEMQRRAPGKNKMSTARVEKDEVEIMSGVLEGKTTGAPLMAMIYNNDQHSKDYSVLKTHMRPGHSDYPAYIKYLGFNDVRGGGHFSGRISAPIVFAGAIAKLILKQKGIEIVGHMSAIENIQDDLFETTITKQTVQLLQEQVYPVLNKAIYSKMQEAIETARMDQDSVGGKIECAILGIPAGIGEPFFDSIESHLASLMFSVPAVKGIHFGNRQISQLKGSQANDCYVYQGEKVTCLTNNNGGITGGISNGMPIIFEVALKPTPSISKQQNTINVETKENTTLEVHGRHDPCIVPRAIVVIEAMAAITMLDFMR